MKIDRLLGILMQLITKKKVTAKQLADYYEVSIRTIHRDMETLNMAGIPLYGDVGKNGGYSLLESYKLDKSFLSKKEANILIKFLEDLSNIGASKEISSIYNKIQVTNSIEDDEKLVIQLNPQISDGFFRENLKLLTSARDSLNKVKIQYYDVNFNETYRLINPYTLLMTATKWYVYAYCELRRDFRLFKLNRIISVEVLNDKFVKKELPEIKPWESSGDGDSDTENIVLKVDINLLGRVAEIFKYHTCDIREDYILINIKAKLDEWLYATIMSLTPYIEIVEPEQLRVQYKTRLEKGLQKNS